MLTIKQVNTGIASLAKSNEKRSSTIHELLVSVVGHAFERGDVRQANALVAAMRKGTDKKAARDWLTTFGPFSFSVKDKALKFNKTKNKELTFNEEYLNSEDCIRWDADTDEGDGAINPLDLYKRITGLIKSAEKAKKDGKREVKHAELISDLARLVIKHKLESADAAIEAAQ